jgi:probable F420-dependent oxidoreductase
LRYSVALPTSMEGLIYPIPFATPKDLMEITKLAEALGFHSVWGNDHMTTQHYVRREYSAPPSYWEPLISYGFLAAETTVIRFGTGVLVTPMRRDIVVVAKQIATLDHFSGGRLMIGVGIGAYREEFEALQPGRSVHRGKALEESLDAFRLLFEEPRASYRGKYYRFEDVEMFPKPLQDPLPIYVGGNSEGAARRAGLYGSGWMPAGMPLETLQSRLGELQRSADKAGRKAVLFDIAPQLVVRLGQTQEEARRHFRESQMYKHLVSLRASTLKDQAEAQFEGSNLIGTPDHVVEKAQALRAAGVTHLGALLFAANTVDDLKDQMRWFASEVAPHLDSLSS